MATYYVKTSGDDANDGLSEANAWATVTKAFSDLVAGDTVYIAPGTYRNTSGYTVANAGASGSQISFIGDPNCEYFSNENPGYVRITTCDTTEAPLSGVKAIDAQQDYITYRNLVVDGAEKSDAVYASSTTGTEAYNCIAFGSYNGFNGITKSTNCMAVVSGDAFYDGEQYSCFGMGMYDTVFCGSSASNCIAVGGYHGFRYTNNNCIAIGSYYGFYYGTQNNCIAIGSNTGFSSGTLTNCKHLYCGYYDDSGTTGSSTQANHIGFTTITKLKALALAFKPDLFFEKDTGDDTVLSTTTEDILGNPRRQNDGTIDIGAFEYADRELDWTNYQTNPPGIKINRKGTELFMLPVKGGTSITVSVQVKFNSTTDKPSLTATGDSITTQTDTAISDGSTWEELSVTFTPSKDDRIEIRLNANDTTSGNYSIFSDIAIS